MVQKKDGEGGEKKKDRHRRGVCLNQWQRYPTDPYTNLRCTHQDLGSQINYLKEKRKEDMKYIVATVNGKK